MGDKQIVTTVIENGQTLLEYSVTPAGDGDLDAGPVECAENATTELVVAIDVSQLKSLVIKASGPCTLKTNDPDTPDDTLELNAAPYAYQWTEGAPHDLLLESDVTSLHVAVPDGGGAVMLTMLGRYDVTP